MKKIACILLFSTFAMLLGGSCSSNKKMPKDVMEELDSIFASNMERPLMPVFRGLKTGKIVITEEEKSKGVSYLLPLNRANELKTLRQKNAALVMYYNDRGVALLYGLPVEPYDMVIAHLKVGAEVGADFVLTSTPVDEENLPLLSQRMVEKFSDQLKEGKGDMYIMRGLALFVESVYLLSQNPDLFLPYVSEEDVVYIDGRIAMFEALVEKAQPYFPSLTMVNNLIKHHTFIKATTKTQLVEQLVEKKADIEQFRNALLSE